MQVRGGDSTGVMGETTGEAHIQLSYLAVLFIIRLQIGRERTEGMGNRKRGKDKRRGGPGKGSWKSGTKKEYLKQTEVEKNNGHETGLKIMFKML